MSAFLFVAVFAANALSSDSDGRSKEFVEKLRSTYDYLPADVTATVRDAKSKQMDQFWALVETDVDVYVPMLRSALQDADANRFFLYDGAKLLAKHAEGAADWRLAVNAVAHARLKDVSNEGYFRFCIELGRHGVDTSPAVFQMLDKPDFHVALAKPIYLELDLGQCVRWCLLENEDERWTGPLIERLRVADDSRVIQALLKCLAGTVATDADAAVRAFAADGKNDAALREFALNAIELTEPRVVLHAPKTSREDFEQFLAWYEDHGRKMVDPDATLDRIDALLEDATALVVAKDAPRLRALRRIAAHRLGEDALGDIGFFTRLIRKATESSK